MLPDVVTAKGHVAHTCPACSLQWLCELEPGAGQRPWWRQQGWGLSPGLVRRPEGQLHTHHGTAMGSRLEPHNCQLPRSYQPLLLLWGF